MKELIMRLLQLLKALFGQSGIERPSPSDWLPEYVVQGWAEALPWQYLKIPLRTRPKIWIPSIPDTNSMDGVFDIGNNNILIAGATPEDHAQLLEALSVGDIAVYRVMQNPADNPNDWGKPHLAFVIHRIIEKKSNEQGTYFVFRGDNNTVNDPYQVRPDEVLWVSIGTIY